MLIWALPESSSVISTLSIAQAGMVVEHLDAYVHTELDR